MIVGHQVHCRLKRVRRGSSRASIVLALALAAGCATLHGPARRGEATVVAERVSDGADVEARDDDGNTPLHLAALYGRESVVEVLLAAGADAGARNDQGATPMHYWAMGRHTADTVASALLAAGADVRAQAHDGATPLHWAAARGARASAAGSSQTSRFVDSLERTARIPVAGPAVAVAAAPFALFTLLADLFGSRPRPIENTTVLVGRGADVEGRDGGGTPLHWAALSDAPADRVTALLSTGADGAARNAAGAMPVDLVPDDSVLWSLLIPFRPPASSGGGAPGAVRNLRVTRLTESPTQEMDDYRKWTWTWTWDRPASDGGHPITRYMFDSEPCRRRSSRDADTFPMTRARSDDLSFTHVEEITGFEYPVPPVWIDRLEAEEEDVAPDLASLWAVNARGAGACVEVIVVDR